MDSITQNDPSTLQNYSLEVFSYNSVLQPYFWWLQPPTEPESFCSRALWGLCTQGHKSYLLWEGHLRFQLQKLWHRFTGSGHRRIIPTGLCHFPEGIPSQQKDLSCTHWNPREPPECRYGEMLSASMKKWCFCVACSTLTPFCTWLRWVVLF